MILIAGAVLGVAAGAVSWRLLRDMFSRDVFTRTNYRGAQLATSAGLVLPLAVFVVTAAVVVLGSIGPDAPGPAQASLTLTALAVGGFSLLGLLDDMAVDQGTSGYRGHIAALAHAKLSAGALKMLVGPAVAIVAVQPVVGGSVTWLLIDGAIVALCANLANLFDRAPGRVTKVALLATAVLVVATAVQVGVPYRLMGTIVIVAAAAGLLVPELREDLMLGDAGANPLGAAIGLGVVMTQPQLARIVVLVMVLALNLVSERVSFSAVIDRVAPLRFVDRLGRRPLGP